jgi:serine O-acetyltransferase
LVFLCDVDIDSVPRGTAFGHPFGICINSGTQIGKNCDIRHGVTLGKINPKGGPERIVIGDDVFIGCNASVLGSVTIGDNCIIGAHALVLKDVPAGERVRGVWK